MSERAGLHRILTLSRAYALFQKLISRQSTVDVLRVELYPDLGSRPMRVLDIGCGPAAFWARYHDIDGLTYVGIEPNRAYVEAARARFPAIELHVGTVPDARDAVAGTFDLVVLEGVLHHIDDGTAREALEFAAERLRPTGRLVTLDTVLLPKQNPIARVLAKLNRGRCVRTLDGCRALATNVFPEGHVSARHLRGQLRVPYDYSVVEVRSP